MRNLFTKTSLVAGSVLLCTIFLNVQLASAACTGSTTLGSASDPASSTKAPGSAIVDAGGFTFTCSGTGSSGVTVTSLTISLAGSGTPYDGLSEVRITDSAGSTLYFNASSTIVSNTMTFTGGTAIPVTRGSVVTFKIRITPKTHANMPAPNGALYALSPVVTSFVSNLSSAGSDSNAGTTTIDNLSPNPATSVSISGGTDKMTLGWTSASGENSTSTILRWVGGSAGAEVPAEGTGYATSSTISTATVACVFTNLTTATVKSNIVDGSGATSGCTTSALADGQSYTYKVFQQDANGNYDTGTLIGTATTTVVAPTVTTSAASSITATGATLNGNITATGGANATIRGFAWGTSPTLVGGDTATTTSTGSFGTGAFTDSSLTLTCNTTYYSRAYAVNSAGTSTGAISSPFTTSACKPTVTSSAATSITRTTAILNGNITADNGASSTVRGFAWGTGATLIGGDTATTTEVGTFGISSFSTSTLAFICNTTYYFRAYAQNSAGTSTGSILNFLTDACLTAPTVTTQSASSITANGATLNGNITATGGENATIRGFAWGTSPTLVGGDTATTTSTGSFGTGAFTDSSLTLVGNTTYYSRAYAVNSVGTSSGAVSAGFLTLPDTPGAPTASAITATTLTVEWTAPTGGASTYKIERCTGASCSDFAEIATGVAGLSYPQTGLTASTVYRYRVRATNATGDGAYATSADITTSSTATTELSAFRLFDPANSYTPGTALAAQNTSATLANAGDSFRMRMLIHFGTTDVAASERVFKLQYALKSGTCDTSFTGETYADVTTGTAISYKDTTGVSDNTALGVAADLTHGGDTIVNQTYEELNNFTNSQSAISAGQDGKWDFSLYDNGGTPGESYCLRVVQSDGSALSSYSQIAEITIPSAASPSLDQIHYRWRNDNGSESSATYDGSEDTTLSTSVFTGDRKRLRFSLSNVGSGSATNYNFKLEYSTTTCSVWSPTASYGSLTTEHWGMDISSSIQNSTPTTNSAGLTDPSGPTFIAGFLQTSSSQTSNLTIPSNRFTELEYAIKSSSNVVTDTTYCFRLTNAGSITNFVYSLLPRIIVRAPVERPSGGGGGNAGGESSSAPGNQVGGGSTGGGGGAGGEGGGTPGGSTGGGGAGGGGNSE